MSFHNYIINVTGASSVRGFIVNVWGSSDVSCGEIGEISGGGCGGGTSICNGNVATSLPDMQEM